MWLGKALLPVVELALQLAALLQPLALPFGEVGVLHAVRRQLRGLATVEGWIQRDEFIDQDAERPVIGDDVMHRQQQHMLILRNPQCPHPQQRTMAQVEWPGDFLAGQLLRFDVRRRPMPQVAVDKTQRQLRMHPLPGLAVFFVERCAQHGVALHQGFEGLAQGIEVQPAAQAQGTRHVVHRTVRFQVPQEPQALLGKGQRLAFARDICLLYTSPSPRDGLLSRMPSSA